MFALLLHKAVNKAFNPVPKPTSKTFTGDLNRDFIPLSIKTCLDS
jgi:hypothetical protein